MNDSFQQALAWFTSRSIWYFQAGSGCCADELLQAFSCKYDLERFGCLPQANPEQADLLIVNGVVTYKAAPHLRAVYERMLFPKYVIAAGACAISGGLFGPEESYSTVAGLDQIIPVDIYVAGCPPRPESLMNGIIKLQEKISGKERRSVYL